MYLPLHVGAVLHPEVLPQMQGDDEGDSISQRNASYSELTGLYWLWKNVDAECKGLVHYRRHLGTLDADRRRAKDPFDRIVSGGELAGLLDKNDVVVAKRRNYYIETVYDHYGHTFDAQHFDACREVLSDRFPEYVLAWDRLMKARGAHVFNMFVMRSDLLDAYCSWVFEVLGQLEKHVNSSEMDAFAARWPGRVAERLLDPWLETNRISYADLPVVSPEPVDWIKKGSGFLAAKFLGKKYEKSF